MYLAFKWLMLMALAMWAVLCLIDVYLETHMEIHSPGSHNLPPIAFICKNATLTDKKLHKANNVKHDFKTYFPNTSILNYLTFCAGALVVSIYNRKENIIGYIRKKSNNANIRATVKKAVSDLNKSASQIWVVMVRKGNSLWNNIKTCIHSGNLRCLFTFREFKDRSQRNNLLLKKLKEVGQERNNLGQLLIAAIHENKNIRLQCQLVNLAKNRLMRQIQDTQKQIKENRSRYVNFQQLYLITHQENVFLKCHIKRLSKEKEEAETKLKMLIKEVFQSNDGTLKTYCTNFIAKTQVSSAFGDVNTEIMNFLLKSRTAATASTSKWTISGRTKNNVTDSNAPEQSEAEDLVPLVYNEPKPKLRGLPGEYVWTVKDRDGIIEKLYEYDYGYNFDNGDTIRRIREYSVYHDKDCLLDFNSKSTTIIEPSNFRTQMPTFGVPSNRNFLTGSPIFQKFLANNTNVVVTKSMTTTPSLVCGQS